MEDLLRLHGHQGEEALAVHEAELHGGLAQSNALAGRQFLARGKLSFVEHSVGAQHLSEPLGRHGGARADDVAAVDEDRPAGARVEHDELALARRRAEERRHVAQRAGVANLAGKQARAGLDALSLRLT